MQETKNVTLKNLNEKPKPRKKKLFSLEKNAMSRSENRRKLAVLKRLNPIARHLRNLKRKPKQYLRLQPLTSNLSQVSLTNKKLRSSVSFQIRRLYQQYNTQYQ